MFEKSKARIAKLEETNETFLKVTTHLKDHREVYIAAPIALGVGYLLRKPQQVNVSSHVHVMSQQPARRQYFLGLHTEELQRMLRDPMAKVDIPVDDIGLVTIESRL